MVRQALGAGWTCHFANDFDGKKALSYQENWGIKGELCVSDIRDVDPGVLGSDIDLAWASFPCQDLSLAGRGRGLKSERSGMFFVFWQKLMAAAKSGAAPKLVVIENVCGMLTSNRGDDFRYVIDTFSEMGYFVGGLVIDAKEFVPQSRKRVFIIGVRKDRDIDPVFVSSKPNDIYHAKSLVRAADTLRPSSRTDWVWFNLPRPVYRTNTLSDILESSDKVVWNTPEKTQTILSKMSEVNRGKVQAAKNKNSPVVGALFMRTRQQNGEKRVFAEIRFDGVSGCLRTPNGGSSKQSILWVDGDDIRSRLLTPRETARLMGLPDSYKLPKNDTAAYHLTGDGVAVPVVEHLSRYLLEPLVCEGVLSLRHVKVTTRS